MFWFLLNAAIFVIFMALANRKYKSFLNPIGFYISFNCLAQIVVPIIYQETGLFFDLSPSSVRYTSILSTIYFVSFGTAIVMKCSPFTFIFRAIYKSIPSLREKILHTGIGTVALLVQFFLAFAVLAVASGAGLMWITDSRSAYQSHRSSVGFIWSFCAALLVLVLLSSISHRKKIMPIFVTTCGCVFLGSFLGSKGQALVFFLVALVYIHYCVRRIPNRSLVLAGVGIGSLALVLQIQQGTASDLLGTLLYFDYFRNSAALVDRFSDLGYHYGTLTLSTLWEYVPRAIYPAKPFAYAEGILTNILFPGAAERGNTPGILSWTMGYADFGLAGTCIYGLCSGFYSKATFELFLERRDAQSLILFAQVGLGSADVFTNAPLPIFLVWLALEMMFVQLASKFSFVLFSSEPPHRQEKILLLSVDTLSDDLDCSS